jgi:hypothetical protein
MTANAWVMASTVLVSVIAATQSARADVNVSTRICASYISQVGPNTLDVRTMEREANQIWAPYGIAIEGLAKPCTAPVEGPIVKVRVRRIDEVRPVGIPRGTLGNIYFVAGKPTPLIDLWADEAVRVMGGNQTMLNQGLSDPRVRIEMGRLLGRSLAHELGHYLLGSTRHTEEGLMRASYGQQDGKRRTRLGLFALDEQQAATVERTLTTWRVAKAERQPRPVETTDTMNTNVASPAEPVLSVINMLSPRTFARHGW